MVIRFARRRCFVLENQWSAFEPAIVFGQWIDPLCTILSECSMDGWGRGEVVAPAHSHFEPISQIAFARTDHQFSK